MSICGHQGNCPCQDPEYQSPAYWAALQDNAPHNNKTYCKACQGEIRQNELGNWFHVNAMEWVHSTALPPRKPGHSQSIVGGIVHDVPLPKHGIGVRFISNEEWADNPPPRNPIGGGIRGSSRLDSDSRTTANHRDHADKALTHKPLTLDYQPHIHSGVCGIGLHSICSGHTRRWDGAQVNCSCRCHTTAKQSVEKNKTL